MIEELRSRLEKFRLRIERKNKLLERRNRRIAMLEKQLKPQGAENLIWAFSASRSGSTWLAAMMGDLPKMEVWKEPSLGELFGHFHYVRKAGRSGKHYPFGGSPRGWKKPMRSFLLGMAYAKFPDVSRERRLFIKESGSGIGAPLIMSALPESPMVVLVRDPRDVVASTLDAHSPGGWVYERKRARGAPQVSELKD